MFFRERARSAGPHWGRERDQQVLIERPVRLMDGVRHIRRLTVEAVPLDSARFPRGSVKNEWAPRSRCETRDVRAPHMAAEEVAVGAWRRTANNSGGPQSGDSEQQQRADEGGRGSFEAAEMCGDRRCCGGEDGITLGREAGAQRRRGWPSARWRQGRRTMISVKVGQFSFNSMIWGTWVSWFDAADNVPPE